MKKLLDEIAILVGFVAIGKSIHSRIVEERVVAIAPWKLLFANSHVLVGLEFGTLVVFAMFYLSQIRVGHRQDDCWDGAEEE